MRLYRTLQQAEIALRAKDAEVAQLRAALGQTKQTLIDVQCYATKREATLRDECDGVRSQFLDCSGHNAKLRAVLAKARPYVEHCAEPGGSDVAKLVLCEIDALGGDLMRPGTVHE